MNTIDKLAAALEAAKENEERARESRIACEEALLALVRGKAEGSVTERGEGWKVTVTYGVNRTVDAAALDAVRARIPAALFEQAITYKPALVLAGVRYLQSNEPDTYAVLAQAITAKPAKPSVKVERMVERMDAAREAA